MAKVFITRHIPEIGIEKLKNSGLDLVYIGDRQLSKKELIEKLKEHNPDALVCLLTDTIDKEVLSSAPNLKICSTYSVGFGHIDLKAAEELGIVVTHTPGVLTETVAEHTAGLICAATQRIVEADKFTRAGKYTGWEPELLLGLDLKGKTLGVLGAGRIGTRVAEIMHHGFSMRIIYHDVAENNYLHDVVDADFYPELEKMLPNVDVLTVHVPLLPSTIHLLDKKKLLMLKKGAVFVNTSRGKVVVESDLVDVLESGHLFAVALDVYEFEPEITKKLLELPNTVLTPHIASASKETRDKMAEMVADNIIAFFKGESPKNQVKFS